MRTARASSRRSSGASSRRAATAAGPCSASSAVTKTLAWARSRVTSTSETLTEGRRCSRTASCTRVPSSRRSCAETRSVRWKLRVAMASPSSERALDLDALEALDLVARAHVVVGLHADTALGTALDLLDVLLEAAQRFQLALEDDRVVAQHADRLVLLDRALDHEAAGDGAELGAAEDLAHLGDADDLLAHFLAQQAGSHLLHLVDDVVDDREVAQVEAVGLDDLAGRGVGADVEADDHRLRGRRQG